ncbi:RICIN domain-containing protein [Lentzea sp. NPDC006480]|uniref:RICIN domain-containing protein n=1 Tax=Lentzea sp. NPDC006480 TaxID=3157176 RepID=UPI0033A43B69
MLTSKRLLTVVIALAAALVTPGLAVAQDVSAQAGPATVIRSFAALTQKCIGLANNGSTANGTRLVLWDCHFHNDQYWYTGDGTTLRSYASGYPNGKCVGLANNGSTANGTELVLWDCHFHNDQNWRLSPLSDGTFALYNAPSGKCAGLANSGSTVNGTKLVLWDCHLHPDQRWY